MLLEGGVVAGVTIVVVTEVLSAFHALHRLPLAVTWAVLIAVAAVLIRRKRIRIVRPRLSRPEVALLAGAAAVVALVALIAIVAPSNNWDAMTYHMARVAHWAQNGSVAHFATSNERQNSLPPFAEFVVTHVYVLTRSDRFVNLVQWSGWIGCAIATSVLAKRLGATRLTQIGAALLVVTIPMAILQGSSTQNDLIVSLWIAAAVAFVAGEGRRPYRDAFLIGAALGLGALTKGTGFVFAAPIAAWYGVRVVRRDG